MKLTATEKEVNEEMERMLGKYPPAYRDMFKEQFKAGTSGREKLEAQVKLKKLVDKYVVAS